MSETPMKSDKLEYECPKVTNSSPSPKVSYGDRFIPTRAGNDWDLTHLPTSSASPLQLMRNGEGEDNRQPSGPSTSSSNKKRRIDTSDNQICSPLYSSLLLNEMFGFKLTSCNRSSPLHVIKHSSTPTARKLFNYDGTERCERMTSFPYSASPFSKSSLELLSQVRKPLRRIEIKPYKDFGVPGLLDDFYLNLLDWSAKNLVAVSLASKVLLWKEGPGGGLKSDQTRLVQFSDDTCTSVVWDTCGLKLGVGLTSGVVQVIDPTTRTVTSDFSDHRARVGVVTFGGTNLIFSGSSDGCIYQRDIREPPRVPRTQLRAHTQEVCGMKWSTQNQLLATGGNDGQVCVWNLHRPEPLYKLNDHVAAVKAIDWCPHEHGMLASGGATADRCIKFWDTLTGCQIRSVNTGSQVCNLKWSKHSKELVSTHGYMKNEINIWKYPTLNKIAELTGHTGRVLYLAMSPDGESIVTGAGDQTLQFWNIFNRERSWKRKGGESSLNLHGRF